MRARLTCLLALAWLGGCGDPARDDAIDRLGGEAAGVRPGPLHRPGQPCVAPCHDGSGPGEGRFSVGGTVFELPETRVPVVDALVHLLDSTGRRYDTATNCAGNFYVDARDWEPVYPMWVSMEFGGVKSPMNSPIFRFGGCADCHLDPASETSAGHVFFAPISLGVPLGNCR